MPKSPQTPRPAGPPTFTSCIHPRLRPGSSGKHGGLAERRGAGVGPRRSISIKRPDADTAHLTRILGIETAQTALWGITSQPTLNSLVPYVTVPSPQPDSEAQGRICLSPITGSRHPDLTGVGGTALCQASELGEGGTRHTHRGLHWGGLHSGTAHHALARSPRCTQPSASWGSEDCQTAPVM